ncbi:MAG: Maf family nucleotide pyrophosphatase, partial [Bifidobacteriaceae bacterium]|nr:Maf family nucleotide pyrophosphatase [Bifidobacteriaceae bacterium]
MGPHVELILASASPARLATLHAAGIDPVVHVSHVDEDAVLAEALAQDPALDPAGQVLALARAKARDVRARAGAGEFGAGALILGCDSMLEIDGQVLGKPHTPEVAFRRIKQQSGRAAVLHTGHWLIDARAAAPFPEAGATSHATVHFQDLTDEEIRAYVATGEPLEVAGAFTIDGLGGPFIRGIEGDHHGVVGVSLPLLRDLARQFGVAVPQLWGGGAVAGGPPTRKRGGKRPRDRGGEGRG